MNKKKNFRTKRKGLRKEKIIIIRVSGQEKKEIEEMAINERKQVSELFRSLLGEHQQKKQLEINFKIAEKFEKLLEEYRELLEKKC